MNLNVSVDIVKESKNQIGVSVDQSPETNRSEGELDQALAEIVKKYYMAVQPPNTIWQHIQQLLKFIPGNREASKGRVQ